MFRASPKFIDTVLKPLLAIFLLLTVFLTSMYHNGTLRGPTTTSSSFQEQGEHGGKGGASSSSLFANSPLVIRTNNDENQDDEETTGIFSTSPDTFKELLNDDGRPIIKYRQSSSSSLQLPMSASENRLPLSSYQNRSNRQEMVAGPDDQMLKLDRSSALLEGRHMRTNDSDKKWDLPAAKADVVIDDADHITEYLKRDMKDDENSFAAERPIPSFEYAVRHRLRAVLRRLTYMKDPNGNKLSNYYILDNEPKNKLAFCINPKVLSTVMHAVMAFIRYPEVCPLGKGHIPGIFQVNLSNSTGRQCYGWRIFSSALRPDKNNAGDTVYVSVVREPIGRFVSGWMDKCYKHDETCYNCPRGDFPCFVQSHYKALSSLVANGTEAFDPSIKKTWFHRTYHWYPQNWVCALTADNIVGGWLKTLTGSGGSDKNSSGRVHVIPYARNESLYASLTSILRQHQNVPEWKLKLIEESLSTKVTGHATFKNPFNDNVNRLIQTDYRTCLTLYKILKSDFDLFHFDPPWCAARSFHRVTDSLENSWTNLKTAKRTTNKYAEKD